MTGLPWLQLLKEQDRSLCRRPGLSGAVSLIPATVASAAASGASFSCMYEIVCCRSSPRLASSCSRRWGGTSMPTHAASTATSGSSSASLHARRAHLHRQPLPNRATAVAGQASAPQASPSPLSPSLAYICEASSLSSRRASWPRSGAGSDSLALHAAVSAAASHRRLRAERCSAAACATVRSGAIGADRAHTVGDLEWAGMGGPAAASAAEIARWIARGCPHSLCSTLGPKRAARNGRCPGEARCRGSSSRGPRT